MKLLQYSGPFAANTRIEVPVENNVKAVHLGIQNPHSPHIGYYTEKSLAPVIRITGETDDAYVLNYNDILEFDNISEPNLDIQILQAMPAEAIIDIALYEKE
jgi:hypothetical protein